MSDVSQGDNDLYVVVNAYWEPLSSSCREGCPSGWHRVVDTARERPDDIREPDRGPLTSARYTVGPRSVVVVLVRPRSL